MDILIGQRVRSVAAGAKGTVLSADGDGNFHVALHWDNVASGKPEVVTLPEADLIPLRARQQTASPATAVQKMFGIAFTGHRRKPRQPAPVVRVPDDGPATPEVAAARVQQAMRDFVAGPEMEMSVHVERLQDLHNACLERCGAPLATAVFQGGSASDGAPSGGALSRSLGSFDLIKLGALTDGARAAAADGGLEPWRESALGQQPLDLPTYLRDVVTRLDERCQVRVRVKLRLR